MGSGDGEGMKRFLHDFVAGLTTLCYCFSKMKNMKKMKPPFCLHCSLRGKVCEAAEEEGKRDADSMMVAKKKMGVRELSCLSVGAGC